MSSWGGCSTCPAWSALRSETLFASHPPPLLSSFVAKARADGARAILATPLSFSAPYWNKLLQASVVPHEAGYLRIRRQARAVDVDSDVRDELAVPAVDFTRYSTRACLAQSLPTCGNDPLVSQCCVLVISSTCVCDTYYRSDYKQGSVSTPRRTPLRGKTGELVSASTGRIGRPD